MAEEVKTPGSLDPCPICLQEPAHPTQLPCSHIFCFLCVKGAVLRRRNCPLCRLSVSLSFFNNPQLVENPVNLEVVSFDGNYHWYYEGQNGWWLYDDQTSLEIEKQFQKEQPKCEVMIAGFIFVIDFEKMIQYRKDIPRRIRKIKRDIETEIERTKGVAGLRNHVIRTTMHN